MAKKVQEPINKVTLTPDITQRLLSLEDQKQAALRLVGGMESQQMAMLAGFVSASGAGAFDPLAWDLSTVGKGYIARILDANGKPVQVLGTMDDLGRMLTEHAEKNGSEPTPLRRADREVA